MNKVEVSRPMVGIFAMQVCAEKSATDDEILEVCNRDNPSGTTHGWTKVVREVDGPFMTEESLPCQCEDHPDRQHILVTC